MGLLKSLVLTKKTPEVGEARHSSFTHFLDLIDACGFDLKVTANQPSQEQLSIYKLIFIDATKCDMSTFFKQPLFSSLYKNRIVLFGVSNDNAEIESVALRHGVRGVFYQNDKLEMVIKGIQTIKDGKYWFKRDTLEGILRQFLGDWTQQNQRVKAIDENASGLTKREKMIVNLIGQGAKNGEIAEQLHISINTVKTHVYSIFRKTSCRNRVELIKWSLEEKAVYS